MDANREDNIWVFDIRADKTVNIAGRLRARCSSTCSTSPTATLGDDRSAARRARAISGRRPSSRRSRRGSARLLW